MIIPWNDQIIFDLENNRSGTTYELLLVPKGISPDSFKTIREALDLGALELQKVGGPP
jgi:hypothetical protein